jgi:small subunit ribosomal protein S11
MAEEEIKTTTEIPEAEAPAAVAAAPVKRKKVKRSVPFGQVHILATFNNTIITVTDPKGEALAASSAGACGFRGSKKGTAYAAQVAAERAYQAARQSYGFSKADVYVKGVGLGRESAIRALQTADIQVEIMKDVTGVPHGGVRPKKARRI